MLGYLDSFVGNALNCIVQYNFHIRNENHDIAHYIHEIIRTLCDDFLRSFISSGSSETLQNMNDLKEKYHVYFVTELNEYFSLKTSGTVKWLTDYKIKKKRKMLLCS